MIELSTIAQKFTSNKKYIISAVVGMLIGFLVSLGFSSCNNQPPMVIIDQKVIADDVTRSQTLVVQSLEEELKNKQSNYDKILKDMETLKAELTAFQTISATTPGKTVSGSKSDVVTPVIPSIGDISPTNPDTPVLDPYGYLSSTQTIFLKDTFGNKEVKIGEASFSGFRESPWDYKILPKTYNVTTVLGKTEDGKQVAYNTFTVEVEGKKYSLPVTGTIMQEKNQDKFYFWNPKVGMAIGGGITNDLKGVYSASVIFTPMSYGEKKNPTWLFAGLGISASNRVTPSLVVAPVSFNLGKINNFTNNTYIGPQIHTNFANSHSIQFGVMVTF